MRCPCESASHEPTSPKARFHQPATAPVSAQTHAAPSSLRRPRRAIDLPVAAHVVDAARKRSDVRDHVRPHRDRLAAPRYHAGSPMSSTLVQRDLETRDLARRYGLSIATINAITADDITAPAHPYS
jgi:hypothetical protein